MHTRMHIHMRVHPQTHIQKCVHIHTHTHTCAHTGQYFIYPHACTQPTRTLNSITHSAYTQLKCTISLCLSRTAAAATRFGLLGLRCEVPGNQVRWLGLAAFERVLSRKQSGYVFVLQVSW